MSDYSKILQIFTKFGLTVSTKVKEAQIKRTLDAICQENANLSHFDDDVADQLWEHTMKTESNNQIALLKDYIQTMIDAKQILRENILKCESELKKQTEDAFLKQLRQSLQSYNQDYYLLTKPFNLDKQDLGSSKIGVKPKANEEQINLSRAESQIFTTAPSLRQESTSLRIVFLISLALLASDLITMFVKHHFYGILSEFTVFLIFFLNYFDKRYIRLCLGTLVACILMDIVWLCVSSSFFWTTTLENQRSNIQTGFLRFIVVLVFINIAMRCFIALLIFRFRNNEQNTKKIINLCGKSWYLDAKIRSSPYMELMPQSSSKNNGMDQGSD